MKTSNWLLGALALSIAFAGCAKRPMDPRIRLGLEYFRSCEAMEEYVGERQDEYESDIHDPVALSSGSSPSEHGTNLQEPGVDESDTVKLSGDRLYIARQKRLEIIDSTTLATTGTLALDANAGTKLFLDGNRLVTVTQTYYYVRVGVYERADSPRLLYETKHRGFTQAMRMKDGKLFLVVQDYLQPQDGVPVSALGVPCQRILRPMVEDFDFSLMKVVALNTSADSLSEESVAILGSGSIVYMSDKHLFIGKSGYFSSENSLLLTQIDVSGDTPVPDAVGKIAGMPNNEHALKERDGYLAVVTNSGWGMASRLTVLKADDGVLAQVGVTEDFAPGESLFAVRYVGDFAYAITYRSKDPLWVLDWSDPRTPAIRGKLEVPGFSTYLHPASGGKLIGIGQAEDRSYELSLFDVSHPENPRRTASLALGQWSTAAYDPHAFFYRDELSLVGVPIYGEVNGAKLVRVQGDNLAAAATLSHASLRSAKCASEGGDIERLFRIGDRIVAISGAALSSHSVSTLGPPAVSRAMDPAGGCRLSAQPGFCGVGFFSAADGPFWAPAP